MSKLHVAPRGSKDSPRIAALRRREALHNVLALAIMAVVAFVCGVFVYGWPVAK